MTVARTSANCARSISGGGLSALSASLKPLPAHLEKPSGQMSVESPLPGQINGPALLGFVPSAFLLLVSHRLCPDFGKASGRSNYIRVNTKL
jgi:hypothetical protein